MSYYNLILWSLLCFSITNVITTSTLLHPAREAIKQKSSYIGQLISCPMCFGFWVGMIVHFILFPILPNFLLDGFLGSGVTWLLFTLNRRVW